MAGPVAASCPCGADQLRWSSGQGGLAGFTHGEASSGELGADDGRIDVVESVVVHAPIGADPVGRDVSGHRSSLSTRSRATTRAEHSMEFGDAGVDVGPVVHC